MELYCLIKVMSIYQMRPYNVCMSEQTIGIGPYPEPWPNDDKCDKELLKNGDKRNVIDKYRYWTVDAIKADLRHSKTGLHIAIENWQHDFNIGTIVRSANAFNVEKVHIIGKRHWNRRGAMVTDRYMDIVNHPTVDDFVSDMRKEGRNIIAIDNTDKAVPLSSVKLPKKSVLVFGGEGPGISGELLDACEQIIMIEQTGSTRSINVGVAAGIVMYAWTQHHALNIDK
jgi:tRNA G18 (ribose-2'-O)-methylase SpoU